MSDSLEVTNLLNRVGAGDASAPDELLPLVYGELRKLAQGYLKNEREGHTQLLSSTKHIYGWRTGKMYPGRTALISFRWRQM